MKEIPILQYQNVGDYPETMMEDGLLPKTFEKQMAFLSGNNYQIVALEQAMDHLNKKAKLNSNSLAITINGGYQDAYTHILPVLKKHGFHATFFLPPEFIEDERSIKGEPIRCLTWDQVKKMIESKMEIGLLAYGGIGIKGKHNEPEVRESIASAMTIFKRKLDYKLRYCAFKEGVPSKALWKFIQEKGFEAVFTQCPTNLRASNRAIGRIQIDDDDHNIFLTKISKTYLFFKDKRVWKYLRKYKIDRVAHWMSDVVNWIKGET